jgi:hypothetical protein
MISTLCFDVYREWDFVERPYDGRATITGV